jgi:hypothetical protein
MHKAHVHLQPGRTALATAGGSFLLSREVSGNSLNLKMHYLCTRVSHTAD